MSDLTFLEQFAEKYAWRQAPAKRRFRFRKRVNRGMEEEHRLALTLGGVIDRALDDDEGLQSSDYSTYQIFEADDLVFKLIDLENIRTSRVGYVPRRGIMSPAYIRLEPASKQSNSRFYYWFFYGAYINNIFNGMGGGVRQNLTPTDLLEFPIPLPDLDTQKAIADFLDRETARIDQLIEKKQRQASLLLTKERIMLMQSFNSLEAITWRIRHLGKLRNGSGFPIELQGDPTQELPFYKVKHLKTYGLDATLIGDEDTVSRETARTLHATIFPARTIVFAKIGAALLLGRFSMLGRTGCIDNNMAAFVANEHLIDPDYALLALSQIDMTTMVQPGTIPSLSTEAFYSYRIRLPTKDVQTTFVDTFRNHRATIRCVVAAIEKSIQRLRELRVAIITAAINGQIDVSTWNNKGHSERNLERIKGL